MNSTNHSNTYIIIYQGRNKVCRIRDQRSGIRDQKDGIWDHKPWDWD